MALTTKSVSTAVNRARAEMQTLGPTLDAADSKIGDGDTGTMLTRFFRDLAAVDIRQEDDFGAAFRALATAGAGSTGSSLGTLLVGALLSVAKTLDGRAAIEPSELGGLLALVRDDMMQRGRAEPGDKTIIDSFDFLVRALPETSDEAEAALRAVSAADEALAVFQERRNIRGRARMYGERTQGLDDPGMLAVAALTRAVSRDTFEQTRPGSGR